MTPDQAAKIKGLAETAIAAAYLGRVGPMFSAQKDLMDAIEETTENVITDPCGDCIDGLLRCHDCPVRKGVR